MFENDYVVVKRMASHDSHNVLRQRIATIMACHTSVLCILARKDAQDTSLFILPK